jgi:glycosyltransferase involved in cell wall biosynthesis
LVFDAHEYYTESPEIVNRPIIKWIWEAISELCIPKADAAYTVGPMLAELMGKKYGIRFWCVRNVPFSITTSNQQIQKSTNQKIILYQGAMNHGRGIEESILAMKQVNAELWLAGDGDLMAELKKLVSENQLNDKVKFLGYVKPTELKAITQEAYIGLNLLQPIGLSYYYSLANKFFDYMQQGIPCISANFPEYQAINQAYNCTLLSSCDVDDIAHSMNLFLNDDELYKRILSSIFILCSTSIDDRNISVTCSFFNRVRNTIPIRIYIKVIGGRISIGVYRASPICSFFNRIGKAIAVRV